MVTPIASGDTNQWDVMEWAWAQGEHMPSPGHAVVLVYLASHAFYSRRNAERARVGQVLRQASYFESVMTATGIASKTTVRNILNDLGDLGYVVRSDRPGRGPQPHRMVVCWDAESDEMRRQCRAGERDLPTAFLTRPTRPRKKAPVVHLRPLAEAT